MNTEDKGILFKIGLATNDMDEYRAIAKAVSKLTAHGRVTMDVCGMERRSFDLPEGGSPWHNYLVEKPTLPCFFPHPDLEAHLPKGYAAKNRELLKQQAAIASEYGLEAAFSSSEPSFWPESFFRQHLELRGPRVDHPRRSTREEFAPCVDQPKVREMYQWMMAELVAAAPELSEFTFRCNDVGSGMCWNSALYPGVHGPSSCSNVEPGVRVKKFLEALHQGAAQGAAQGGKQIKINFQGNFWNNEVYSIRPNLPANTYLDGFHSDSVTAHSMHHFAPVRGCFDPLALIKAISKAQKPNVGEVRLTLHPDYRRGVEQVALVERVTEMICDCMERPVTGLREQLLRLAEYCEKWAGPDRADELFEALVAFHEAFSVRNQVFRLCESFYLGVSGRHITRPLVIKPELLTEEEEAYFLPHVYNIRLNGARMEYTEINGGRKPTPPLIRKFGSKLAALGKKISSMSDAPEGEWLKQLGLTLRLRASMTRSACNFTDAQAIRDKYAEILAGEPRIPASEDDYFGDPGNLEFNELMYDELENAGQLLELLKNGGEELVISTPNPELADCFMLGADLPQQIEKKIDVMRAHWRDIENYLASPLK